MSRAARNPTDLKREPRFGILFVSLIFAMAAPAMVPDSTLFDVGIQILVTFILLAGLTAVGRSRRFVIVGLTLVLPAVALNWLARIDGMYSLLILSSVLATAFLVYLAVLILNYVMRAAKVDSNTIAGAVCVYILMGYAWGLGYFIMEAWSPAAIIHTTPLPPDRVGGLLEATSDAVYFSFATLTTLGYGDITPLSAGARTLAVLEAIMGQLYLVVLIARFVGLHIVRGTLTKG